MSDVPNWNGLAVSPPEVDNGNDPPKSHPSHNRTWSGGCSEMVFDGSPIAKPPIAPRSKSQDQERQTYHDHNRKFLEQAEKEKSKLLSPPAASRAITSPGLASRNRKRLESIEENQAIPRFPNLQQKHHGRISSDEMSVLSVLSNSPSWSNGSHNSGMSQWSKSQWERFERQRQEQFESTKQDIGRKLSNALADGERVLTEKEKQEFIQEYMEELERERETLLLQWKSEWEEERGRELHYKAFFEPCLESLASLLATIEVFLANLPLTIGAVGLSWVTMGTVWFKFMEENVDFCVPVHFYSSECTFPEFPGCFECDTTQPLYQLALDFHFACTFFAGFCCVLFVLKVIVAWKVVVDDLCNPTTSTPFGVICITIVCVFAGRGVIGGGIVVVTSIFHLMFAFWFLYMSVYKFGLYPDPGWFPSTVGLTYAAVKTWLYYPFAGLFLLTVSTNGRHDMSTLQRL